MQAGPAEVHTLCTVVLGQTSTLRQAAGPGGEMRLPLRERRRRPRAGRCIRGDAPDNSRFIWSKGAIAWTLFCWSRPPSWVWWKD